MNLEWMPFAVAIGGMSAMLMCWLLVQRLWARVFTTGDCDVLKLRAGCDACAHEGSCARPQRGAAGRATRQTAAPEGGTRIPNS